MKSLLLSFIVVFIGCSNDKYKIDPKTGGKIIWEQQGRKIDGGVVLWEQTIELPDDWVDTTHYTYTGCDGLFVCGAEKYWCKGDTCFYILDGKQDTIIISKMK